MTDVFKFPTIEDEPIQSVQRTLQRQDITQSTVLSGDNKKIEIKYDGKTFLTINKDGITLNDGNTDRIFIGYQVEGF